MAENRRQVVWSPEALADLGEIWSYYAEVAGRQTADNIARKDRQRLSDCWKTYPFAAAALRDELRLGLGYIQSPCARMFSSTA